MDDELSQRPPFNVAETQRIRRAARGCNSIVLQSTSTETTESSYPDKVTLTGPVIT